MEIGIECFDANGNKTCDSDYTTAQYLGTGSTGTVAGSLTDSAIGDNRVWTIITSHDDAGSSGWRVPKFTCSTNTLSWTFNEDVFISKTVNCNFLYGIY